MHRREILTIPLMALLPAGWQRQIARAATARVAVVGGGFGGMAAVRMLRRWLPETHITLINQSSSYTTGPGGNFALIGHWGLDDITHSYANFARRANVEMVYGEAMRIASGVVVLQNGGVIRADYIIVAPGVAFDATQMPGYTAADMGEIPHAWHGKSQLAILRAQLQAMPEDGVVAILPPPLPHRCPPAPYERASLIAEWMDIAKPGGKVLILDGKPAFPQQTLFSEVWNVAYRERIEWRAADAGGLVEAMDVKNRRLITEFGEEQAAVINYIPPQRAGAVATRSGLADAGGWCPVHARTMESLMREEVYVVGDAAAMLPMPKSAASAMSQGTRAAMAIVEKLGDGAVPPTALESLCYSHAATDAAFREHGIYRAGETGQAEKVRLSLSAAGESAAIRRQTADEGRAWYRQTVRRLFA